MSEHKMRELSKLEKQAKIAETSELAWFALISRAGFTPEEAAEHAINYAKAFVGAIEKFRRED